MTEKITLEELYARLADLEISEEDLRPYFELDEQSTHAFAPQLTIDRTKVTIPRAAEGAARSAQLLNFANTASRMRRRWEFNKKITSGKYRGPIIVSEGDSWFQYPIKLTDVIDHLSRDFAVLSLGAAGDTTANMIRKGEFMDAIEDTNASVFLFSGGGNDLVADGNLASHLKEFDSNVSAEQHLLPSFDTLVERVIQQYDQIFRRVIGRFPMLHIFCHGYDYTIPNKGKWLGKPMISRGIKKADVQRAITRVMMDRFNTQLASLAEMLPNVHYVDNRGIVTDQRWHDELHPTDAGYGDVAAGFKAAIESVTSVPRTRGGEGQRRSPGPTGHSLHLGLNFIDPNHYAGWNGELVSAEYDAEDMEALAADIGYKTKLLKRDAVTREAVLQELDKAVRDLKAGDIYLLTFAGHGGQVPDFNGDERQDRADDRIDETFCLFDAQIIDDELAVRWAKFKPGVRVLVIADCCHSGSAIRGAPNRFGTPSGLMPGAPVMAARSMPDAIAARVARNNRGQYREISRSLGDIDEALLSRELTNPIACSVRLLSACMDNQVAMDGIGNGAFTAELLTTWDEGRFDGNYLRFHGEIKMRMPPSQTPNHWNIGARNPIFDGQRPFDI